MGDKDPPPFGYFFNDDFFGAGASSTHDSAGQSLLSDLENQSLADFFSSTDPFHLPDSHAFSSPTDTKDGLHDYNNWGDFIAPAQVHRVTATIPDQVHSQHSLHNPHTFAPSLPANHFDSTHDDLQAASTLFHNSQSAYLNAATQPLHQIPSSTRAVTANGALSSSQNSRPMVATSHGLINEQLAALLPNHAEDGTLDAQLAAHWANSHVPQQHEAEYGLMSQKPNFGRSYTFGTDHSFNNPTGYAAPNNQGREDASARRSLHDLPESENLLRMVTGIDGPIASPTNHTQLPLALAVEPSDAERSDDATTSEEDEEESRPIKKRRKSKHRVSKDNPRKGARNSKSRKASLIDESGKKKRASAAAQRLQRENLTEEQKRNNHILSEQKRRNLIKRGFDDLHHLVPEIRNGGLSKSSVLMEAGNFLEKLIEDNITFSQLAGGISAV
jgi:hypothetical protein